MGTGMERGNMTEEAGDFTPRVGCRSGTCDTLHSEAM